MIKKNVKNVLTCVSLFAIVLLVGLVISNYVIVPTTVFIVTSIMKLATPWNVTALMGVCAVCGLVLFTPMIKTPLKSN